ncbi:MAG: aminoacyl-tRNA hydrolase [Pseudomonadota bacterium]
MVAEQQIKIIVGLGNPGKDYFATRHNVGFWLVEQLATSQSSTLASFSLDKKFSGETAKITLNYQPIWLLKPLVFMNRSGLAIKQLASFYKISPENILVVHDDLDLPAGTAKIKKGGGHGGHNGLRDSINQLQSKDFYRLRIGIGHPGNKNQVSDYVLGAPSKADRALIEQAIDNAIDVMGLIIEGKLDQAMNKLHSK